jgi:predicted Zn finger-like uncharacterized protein
MIITCPHCQTKYQVTYEAIGSAGRKVQCAHCQQAWQQTPLDPEEGASPAQKQAAAAISEDALDDAMEAEMSSAADAAKRLAQEQAAEDAQHRAAAVASKTESATARKRQKDFRRRQSAMAAALPLGRLRRSLRVVGAVMLAGVLAGGFFGRAQVVEQFPAMAGVYEAIGLGVNVVGLDFSNVTTLRTLRDGKEVLMVSAQIVGLMPKPVLVPAVVVTLLDEHGQGIYEWSVTPSVRDMMAGERSTFDTQLTMPPVAAMRVRLSFAGGQSLPVMPTAAASAGPASNPAAPVAATDHSSVPEHH